MVFWPRMNCNEYSFYVKVSDKIAQFDPCIMHHIFLFLPRNNMPLIPLMRRFLIILLSYPAVSHHFL